MAVGTGQFGASALSGEHPCDVGSRGVALVLPGGDLRDDAHWPRSTPISISTTLSRLACLWVFARNGRSVGGLHTTVSPYSFPPVSSDRISSRNPRPSDQRTFRRLTFPTAQPEPPRNGDGARRARRQRRADPGPRRRLANPGHRPYLRRNGRAIASIRCQNKRPATSPSCTGHTRTTSGKGMGPPSPLTGAQGCFGNVPCSSPTILKA
jgi:hypothetical protein